MWANRFGFILSGSGLTINVGDVFTLAAVGTTVYAFQNSTQLGSVTDSSYAAGGASLLFLVERVGQGAASNFAIGSASAVVPPNFNSARKQNFPSIGFPGDLWFDTDTKDLFMAV